MSLSPSDILQRLKQLKLWQESQDELLKKTKNLIDTSTASDYQTIEGLSDFDSTLNQSLKTPVNVESQVISPSKTFNELLEEKLAQDPGPEKAIPAIKRPFLKKGAGLERFKIKPRPQKTVKPVKASKKVATSVTPLRAPDLAIKPKATWTRADESSEHVKKINSQLNKSEGPSDQTLYEKQLEKELLIFEALEQRAEDSSFCSTNSSVVRILSSTPSKIQAKIQATIPEEKRVHWETQDTQSEDEIIETTLDKRDIAEILLRLKGLTESAKPQVPSIIDASDDEKWSSIEPSSDNTSISSTDLEATLRTSKCDIGVGTDNQNCAICGDKLQKTITDYETKIREVIQDKNTICEIKKQLEQREKDFLKKKRDFEDEKQDLVYELEAEKKKLLKEKQVFQTYMKESQNRPNKKERQEISNLKQEVADLTETLKLKESKNGMTQARLRNQIKQLEKENANLKDEVEKLTKENAKLSASQKMTRKSSDSKILHEINKNISKLAKTSKKTEIASKNNSLDTEDSFFEMETNRELEMQYENTFRNQVTRDVSKAAVSGKSQHTLDDGSKQIKYSNGNLKTVSPDGNFITVQYFNGDKQETNLLDGTVKYFFAGKGICQTTYPDGVEMVEFPEGILEKRYPDGKSEITLPDGVTQTTFRDGTQETKYTDGSVVKINTSGDKTLLLPNGQKEIETKEFKRREYPDGTVKILYPDGTQETKYANGRIRIKDGNGTLIVDTQS
ncbi:centromere protein J [Zophobas morio]|uniref:centromere protein J n=1 Tax=Zophobas morio TaxID=2755281 RepID=UPI0030833AFA